MSIKSNVNIRATTYVKNGATQKNVFPYLNIKRDNKMLIMLTTFLVNVIPAKSEIAEKSICSRKRDYLTKY
jgi:hypothetical protein